MKRFHPFIDHPFLMALIVSLLLALLANIGGVWLHTLFPTFDAWPLFIILLTATVLLGLVNRISARSFAASHFGLPPEERRTLLETHRERCVAEPDRILQEMRDMIVLPVLLVVLYSALMLAMAVTVGMLENAYYIPLFLPVIGLSMLLYRHFSLLHKPLNKSTLAAEGHYPHLEALAKKAADTVGIRGRLRLEFPPDITCDVARFGKTYVVLIGTHALSILTEEELYAALLTAFELHHPNTGYRRVLLHHHMTMLGSARPEPMTWGFDLFYAPASAHAEWDAPFYNMAFDQRLARRQAERLKAAGMTEAAHRMHGKLAAVPYFIYESVYLTDDYHYYKGEAPDPHHEQYIGRMLRRSLIRRRDVWGDMIVEALPRENFIGATYAEHCRYLGVSETHVFPSMDFFDEESPYGREVMAAIDATDSRVLPSQEAYSAARKRNYLDPLAIVTEWEAARDEGLDCEIARDTVINAYDDLARYSEAEALCDHILETETNLHATVHALYYKGHRMLRRYETDGIDLIYRAIDLNKNYMQAGLENIEKYCCLCGLSDELANYRRRAANLLEANAYNHESAGSLSPSDQLVPEEGLSDLDELIAFMADAGDGCLERIFLVRKIISEDFYTSAFVLYFTPGADEQSMHRAYDAIFNRLDTDPLDRQFSLFLYDRRTEAAVKRVKGSMVWERPPEPADTAPTASTDDSTDGKHS